jgi:hypothetical protein
MLKFRGANAKIDENIHMSTTVHLRKKKATCYDGKQQREGRSMRGGSTQAPCKQ